jgi:uncharacterized protein
VKKPRLLRIPIAALKQGANRLRFELDITDIGGERREVAENPLFEQTVGLITIELEIVRSGRRFLVNGIVRFRAALVCAVCAKEFSRDFAEPLETEFLGEGEVPAPDGKVMDGRDVEWLSFKDDHLDLGPLVRDAIHLAIPIAPVCRAGCRGRCAGCGRDLNDGPCDCPPPADSPFIDLKQLVEPPPDEPS